MFVATSGTNVATTSVAFQAESSPLMVSREALVLENPTEMAVKEYFKDVPMLVTVAKCESHFIHFNKDGEVHRGRVNQSDVGVMQINEFYHLKTAKAKGFDIHSLSGNLAYARDLYEREGLKPWVHSSACWNKTNQIASTQ